MFFRIKTNKLQFSLQTPHAWKQVHLTTFLSGRASRCTLRKASFTLETALALPAFLFAVTALLYLFSFSALQAKDYRKLIEKAELLAVTAEAFTRQNPYITLYDYETAKLPVCSRGIRKQRNGSEGYGTKLGWVYRGIFSGGRKRRTGISDTGGRSVSQKQGLHLSKINDSFCDIGRAVRSSE